MKLNELKQQTQEELRTHAAELAEHIRAVHVGVRTQTHKQSHELKTLRAERAQVLTFIRQNATLNHS